VFPLIVPPLPPPPIRRRFAVARCRQFAVWAGMLSLRASCAVVSRILIGLIAKKKGGIAIIIINNIISITVNNINKNPRESCPSTSS
jgi:hypothetical protein